MPCGGATAQAFTRSLHTSAAIEGTSRSGGNMGGEERAAAVPAAATE